MNTTIKNIISNNSAFATSCKWDANVVSNFDAGGGQLRDYIET